MIKSTLGKIMRDDVITLVWYLYVCVRRFINLSYLRFNNYINTYLSFRKVACKTTTNPIHSVLLIGDTTALGLGDTGVVFGATSGLCPWLLDRIYKSPAVRRQWAVLNFGSSQTTSQDWSTSGSNFLETFGSPKPSAGAATTTPTTPTTKIRATSSSSIVIMSMGLSDITRGTHGFKIQSLGRDPMGTTPIHPEEELPLCVKNMRETWRELKRRGKRVVVVGILPNGSFIETFGVGKVRRINRMVEQQIKLDAKASSKSDNLYPVKFVMIGGNLCRTDMRSFDGLHLNRKGYNVLAGEVFDLVKGDMVKAEFEVWKGKIGPIVPVGAHKTPPPEEEEKVDEEFEIVSSPKSSSSSKSQLRQRPKKK